MLSLSPELVANQVAAWLVWSSSSSCLRIPAGDSFGTTNQLAEIAV